MPIVIKEIIVRTTVEKTAKEVVVDEKLINRIEKRVLNKLRDEELPGQTNRRKNR